MKIYLSLVLACYNEAEHLIVSFSRIYAVLQKLKKPYEVIFVDDQSKDSTREIIKKIINDYKKRNINFKIAFHKKNLGRGRAVMDGIRLSQGQITGFLDVDLEVGPEYILQATSLLKRCDAVVGKRSFPFSFKTIHRYIASKVYARMASLILSLPVADSEAGFKFFKKAKITKVLPDIRNDGWFWDTEIIALAKLYKLRIKELPVKYIRRTDKTSTVNTLRDSIIYFWNLIWFRIRLNLRHFEEIKRRI